MSLEAQTDLGVDSPGPVSERLTLKILRSIEEVETARTFWCSSSGVRDSDIDIYLTGLKCTDLALRPHVLVLYRGGEPSALMAGRIEHKRVPFQVGYFNLFTPMARVMTFSYGALRGDACSENCEQLIGGIIQSLKNREADVALFEYIDRDGAVCRFAQTAPGFLLRDHCLRTRPHRKREISASPQQFYAGLSYNERKHFRKIAKKLTNDFSGQVRVVCSDDPADLSSALEVVEEVAEKTWQRRLGHGFALNPPIMNFLKVQAEKRWLRIYILYLANQSCAFWIGAVYHGVFYSDFMGYDPAFNRYSPGMHLFSQMMEGFCSQGVQTMDFGFSDEEWKERLGSAVWRETSLHVFSPSLKGLSLSIMRAIAFILHEPIRALLTRVRLIDKAKKAWRNMTVDRRERSVT